MLKNSAFAVVAILAVIPTYAATRPDTCDVEHTASVKASPQMISPASTTCKGSSNRFVTRDD